MNSRTVKYVRNTAQLDKRHAYRVLVEKPERHHWEDLGIDRIL
jgi:hypothetical protein